MPQNSRAKSNTVEPKRYPRYAHGNDISEPLERIWRRPRFRFRSRARSTEFIFRLDFSIPEKLKRTDRAVYSRFFPSDSEHWTLSVKEAYGRLEFEGKPLNEQFEFLFKKIVTEALDFLLDKHSPGFGSDEETVAKDRKAVQKALVRTGPVKDERKRERRALRLAKRYRELLPRVRELRKFVREKERSMTDGALRHEVQRAFKYDWIRHVTKGDALKNLLAIADPRESRIDTLASKKWTPRQLTLGVLVCEELERDSDVRLSAATIYKKYIRLGNRLLSTAQPRRLYQ